MNLRARDLERIIDRALAEDLCLGDPTTEILIPRSLPGTALLVAKKPGTIAGIVVAEAVFRRVDPDLAFERYVEDGAPVQSGQGIGAVEGRMAGILTAERTALNFIQHMSGIATLTAQFVEAAKSAPNSRAAVVDTRKTTPGLRALEKYAVTVGGGRNHRMALGDGILIKDNHIDALRVQGMTVREVVEQARREARHTVRIEVEVRTLEEVSSVLDGGADIILLDNMSPDAMAEAVKIVDGRALLEASGQVSLDTIRAVASTGVDLISVGALTHSAPALDISLDYQS